MNVTKFLGHFGQNHKPLGGATGKVGGTPDSRIHPPGTVDV